MKKDGIQKRKRKPKNASADVQNAAAAAAAAAAAVTSGQAQLVPTTNALSSSFSSSLAPSIGSSLSSSLTSGLTSSLTGTLLPGPHHHSHGGGNGSPGSIHAHHHHHHHGSLVGSPNGTGQPLSGMQGLMGGNNQLTNLNRAALQLSKLDDHLAAVASGHQVSSAAASAGNVIIVDSNLHHHYSKLGEVFYPNSAGAAGAVITNLGMNGARLESVLLPQTQQQLPQQVGGGESHHGGGSNTPTGSIGNNNPVNSEQQQQQQMNAHQSPGQVPSPNAPSSAALTRQVNLLPVEQFFTYTPSPTVKLEAKN